MKKSHFVVFCIVVFISLGILFYALSYSNSKNSNFDHDFDFDGKIKLEIIEDGKNVFAKISYTGDKSEAIVAFKKEHIELVQSKNFFSFYKKIANSSKILNEERFVEIDGYFYHNLKESDLLVEIQNYKVNSLKPWDKFVYDYLPSFVEFKFFMELTFLEKGYDNDYTYYLLTTNSSKGDKTTLVNPIYQVIDFKNPNLLIEGK